MRRNVEFYLAKPCTRHLKRASYFSDYNLSTEAYRKDGPSVRKRQKFIVRGTEEHKRKLRVSTLIDHCQENSVHLVASVKGHDDLSTNVTSVRAYIFSLCAEESGYIPLVSLASKARRG